MTQSVADKTPIPAKTWRRHTDPPGLWIGVATASVTIHLLLFFLFRSYIFISTPQDSSAVVPIELVEIPSSSPSTKPVTQSSQASPPQQVTSSTASQLPPSDEDNNAIAFTKEQPPQPVKASKPKTQANPPKKITVEKKIATLETKPVAKPELKVLTPLTPDATKPISTPTPETPENQTPSPTPTPETTENQTPSPTPTPETTENTNTTQQQLPLSEQNQPSPLPPNTDTSPRPDEQQQPPPSSDLPNNLPSQPSGDVKVGQETSLNKEGGGIAVATWEVEPGALKNLPDNPAQPKTNIREKLLDFPSLNQDSDFQPKDFRVFLFIDNNTGKLTKVFIYPEDIKSIPEAQRSQYQKYVEEIFQDVEFTTASNNGIKSESAQLVVRIKIERR
ncbi:hypothetical protein [Iningainema tapete]|uniref:Uncharacterized protein n=1 Tax=Iningainema tapete BLCC-T55 TaxID=2748662 RepID=A0A8J6XKU9_9CYAN|nr:hypothetical protein [Iningainema tapete]MBD2774536.1 hypothetical protein [Iningainema tapete BLCC-T55]